MSGVAVFSKKATDAVSPPNADSSVKFDAVAHFHLGDDPSCECMACDLPEGADHGPVRWNLLIRFPGPYPREGEVDMLLCQHCKDDWVDGTWDPPLDNFVIVNCYPV